MPENTVPYRAAFLFQICKVKAAALLTAAAVCLQQFFLFVCKCREIIMNGVPDNAQIYARVSVNDAVRRP